MHIKGYGTGTRFGMEWPVTLDLECQPGYVSASTYFFDKEHPLKTAILVVKDKHNQVILYVFQYYDDIEGVVPIDDDTELKILYDSRKDK